MGAGASLIESPTVSDQAVRGIGSEREQQLPHDRKSGPDWSTAKHFDRFPFRERFEARSAAAAVGRARDRPDDESSVSVREPDHDSVKIE